MMRWVKLLLDALFDDGIESDGHGVSVTLSRA